MDAKLLFIHAISPLHAGVGQGVGVIDQPIAREKATGIPYLPGSSIKGVLRDACEDEDLCARVFGPKTDNGDAHAGSVHFTDARLLLLPVRSLQGVFAWVTSPLLLRRFSRDIESSGTSFSLQVPSPNNDDSCLVNDGNSQIVMRQGDEPQVILEDIPLTSTTSDVVKSWGGYFGKKIFPEDADWQAAFSSRLCVVSDDTLSFLLETTPEVRARIRLESETKVVKEGALWYEETLPTETILTGLVTAVPVKKSEATAEESFQEIQSLAKQTLQFGGNATTGQGLCKVRLIEEVKS